MMRVTWDQVLDLPAKPEEIFARIPKDSTVKGMFPARLIEIDPKALERVKDKLVAPPKLGRYMPFYDCPSVDFSRLAHAVAVAREPRQPVTEAMRRLARHDFSTFALSSIGKVTMALMGDARSALEMLPRSYSSVLKGVRVTGGREPDGTFLIRYDDFPGWPDCYPLGTIEGLCAQFGAKCIIDLERRSPTAVTYRVKVL